MHWAVTVPAEVVNWRGGPGVGLATEPADAAGGVGLAGRALAEADGDGVAVPLGDGEAGSAVAAPTSPLSSGGIGAGGWTSPPTPPITVRASMLTATDATAPTVHAAAPVDIRRSAELTGPPSHGA
jgi:hypothetical protein